MEAARRHSHRGCAVETYRLEADGAIPNSQLPLLVYRDAFNRSAAGEPGPVQELFARHGWTESWVDGIFRFHHFHSTAHEVLGCFSGKANVRMGGPSGVRLEVGAGDVVVIPAGVAHKNEGASRDFGVVGAYPRGQRYDMRYGKREARPGVEENIRSVPLPKTDPVFGSDGPLHEHWLAGC